MSIPNSAFPISHSRQSRANYAPDMAWEPLSKEQRQSLARLAKRAWNKHLAWKSSAAFDTWRHEQCIKAIGRRITEAGQRDFLPLRAHFLDLLGQSGVALNVLLQAESEPQRIALFKLQSECSARRLPLAYPEAICRRQYRCGLAEANAQQIWRLLFTVRNRRSETKKPFFGFKI